MCATYLLVMCRSQYPPNFSEKKTVRIKIRYLALKNISYFWFPQGMIIFPGGVRQKRNFRRGGGVRFGSQFLENPEGRGGHRKNPFRWGGYGYFLELHICKNEKFHDMRFTIVCAMFKSKCPEKSNFFGKARKLNFALLLHIASS